MADHDPKQPADKAALVEKNNCLDTSVTFSSRKVEWDLTHLTKQLPSQWAICTTVLESLPQLRPSCSSLENEENMKNMRPKDRFLSITKLQLPQVLTSTIKPSSMGTDVVQPETKLTPTERQSYFGLDAKQRLHQVYQKVAAQKSDFLESATDLASAAKVTYRLPRLDLEAAANPNQEPGEALEDQVWDQVGLFTSEKPLTARHHFAALCLEQKLTPAACLMLRKSVTTNLDLSYMSMGDEYAVILSKILPNLPMLHELNLRDNRLTDVGLGAIVQVIIQKSDLTVLNIGQNKIDGETAQALADYIASPSCSIQELYLSNADVDDLEVQTFTTSLHTNRSIKVLDLSHNLIGVMENINVVQPDFVTGGEAIAEMLLVNNSLTSLNLAWNLIRKESAVAVGQALAHNTGLISLNLSYNALANDGSQAVGHALVSNNCLEALDLSYNNVPYQGAFVLAKALGVNTSLNQVLLNGNPLGKFGGKALLQAVCNHEGGSAGSSPGPHLALHMDNCNFDISDKKNAVFDPDEASGFYTIHCDIPFERSIALELLSLANNKAGCKFLSIVHHVKDDSTSGGGGAFTSQEIQLELCEVSTSRSQLLLNHRRPKTPMLASDISSFELKQMFHTIDRNASGSIDAEELHQAMLTYDLTPKVGEAERLIARFDLDKSGSIEVDEFIELMLAFDEDEVKTTEIVDKATGYGWEIPPTGKLEISFLDLHLPSAFDEVLQSSNIGQLLETIKKHPNRVELIKMAKNSLCLKVTGAEMVLDALHGYIELVDAMVLILPHVINRYSDIDPLSLPSSSSVNELIHAKLNTKEQLLLAHKLGPAYLPIIGLPTGHYKLDLGQNLDRLAMKKVLEVNNHVVQRRQDAKLTDTSQDQNNMGGYRNFSFNGIPTTLTVGFFDKLPKFGHVEFDFVLLQTPAHDYTKKKKISRQTKKLVLTGTRFQQWIKNLQFHHFASMGNSTKRSLAKFTTRCYDLVLECQERRSFEHLLEVKSDQKTPEPHKVMVWDEASNAAIVWTVRRVFHELRKVLSTRCISMDQAVRVLLQWPTAFASSRIDACLLMFNRIVDLHALDKMLQVLTDAECAMMIYRLGWLNIWTPLNPDNYFELNLALSEQRQVATMLVKLAVEEPGENWQRETYGWSREEDIPGWELNVGWTKDDGTPYRGYLRLEYYSGADLGCAPHWPTRESLMEQVLIKCPEEEPLAEFQAKLNIQYQLGRL